MLEPGLVFPWPTAAAAAREQLSASRMVTISIVTGTHIPRERARMRIRHAANELVPAPGAQGVLSISHTPMMSVAVIGQARKVGVDIVNIDEVPQQPEERLQVAVDFLGPQVAMQLQSLSGLAQEKNFAIHWARWEAGLKCHGLGLAEWSPELHARVARCEFHALHLPPHTIGCIATSNV